MQALLEMEDMKTHKLGADLRVNFRVLVWDIGVRPSYQAVIIPGTSCSVTTPEECLQWSTGCAPSECKADFLSRRSRRRHLHIWLFQIADSAGLGSHAKEHFQMCGNSG